VKERHRGLVPLLDGPAVAARLAQADDPGALEGVDVVIEARGRLSEELGDLHRGAWLLAEQLDHPQAERVCERA
jgi:hypothetical protein